jgi:hypothetical protein
MKATHMHTHRDRGRAAERGEMEGWGIEIECERGRGVPQKGEAGEPVIGGPRIGAAYHMTTFHLFPEILKRINASLFQPW